VAHSEIRCLSTACRSDDSFMSQTQNQTLYISLHTLPRTVHRLWVACNFDAVLFWIGLHLIGSVICDEMWTEPYCTLRHGFGLTSNDVLNFRRWLVVRIVRGRLGPFWWSTSVSSRLLSSSAKHHITALHHSLLGRTTYLSADLRVGFTAILSSFCLFSLATVRAHMLGSGCDLKMYVWNLGHIHLIQLGGPKPPVFDDFATERQFHRPISSEQNMIRIIGQVRWKLQGICCVVSKCHEFRLTNGLKLDRSFYPPSVNSALYFIARLRTRRSANRTQPNFATCWEVNRICIYMLKIWGVYPPKIGELKLLILWRFSSGQNYARWRKNKAESFTRLP